MKLVGLLLAAVALLLVAMMVITYAPRLEQKAVGPAASQNGGAQVSVEHLYDSAPAYRVSAQYPQFGIPAIDARIKQTVEAAVQEFEALPANPPDSATAQSQFTGSFDKVYVGSDIVSTELILSQYTGGAHGITALVGLNFDRATGQELTLDDALALTGLTLEEVAASSTAQFDAKFGLPGQGGAWFPDGARPTPDNYNAFVVSADAVTFIFQEYQVAAYAAGAQELSFPRVK